MEILPRAPKIQALRTGILRLLRQASEPKRREFAKRKDGGTLLKLNPAGISDSTWK
jgi:hypothetical protein